MKGEMEMSKTMKRVISFAFVLIFVFSLSVPAFAASGVTPVTGTAYLNLGGPAGKNGYGWLVLAYGNKRFSIDRSTIEVSGAGARLEGTRIVSNEELEEYLDNGNWKTAFSNSNYEYVIKLKMKKTGTTNITYYIGSKKYTLSVKIGSYQNPVKTITLTGVKNGKNFASLTSKKGTGTGIELPLKANAKKAVLKVKPASGWKIRGVSIVDTKSGEQLSRVCRNNGGSLMSSVTLNWGTLKANRNYEVHVDFINTSTRVSLGWTYKIQGSKA